MQVDLFGKVVVLPDVGRRCGNRIESSLSGVGACSPRFTRNDVVPNKRATSFTLLFKKDYENDGDRFWVRVKGMVTLTKLWVTFL